MFHAFPTILKWASVSLIVHILELCMHMVHVYMPSCLCGMHIIWCMEATHTIPSYKVVVNVYQCFMHFPQFKVGRCFFDHSHLKIIHAYGACVHA